MNTASLHHRNGFTFVELSMVLVIIALVAGGILVGRDLVRHAELQRLHKQHTEIITSMRAFQTKFDCLPGDCPFATSLFGTDSNGCPPPDGSAAVDVAVCNGDGDGTLWNGADGLHEDLEVWRHLAAAQLLGGTYTSARTSSDILDVPALRAQFNCPPVLGDTKQCWRWNNGGAWLGMFPPSYHLLLSIPQSRGRWILTPTEAAAYDAKYDDGNPATGNLHTLDAGPLYGTNASPNCTLLQADGSYLYNTTDATRKDERDCGIEEYTALADN